ncbi:MAG: DNA polymerase III subunit delta [Clostridia bacterium]|nr:DNA polymerase III subunit delta [Clostridia bacterium]
MQINDELSVKKHIQAGSFSSLYFVYGDESYLASHYANTLASSITDTSGMSFNYYYFDSETITFDSFYEACESLPMMSDRVCIFVKDFPFLKTNADELKQYYDYFSQIPETTTAIFLVTNEDVDVKQNSKWKAVIDSMNANGVIFCLSKRTDNQIADLLVRSAGKRNASISKETAEFFVSTVGNDMTVLLNEFDKLCAYSGGNEITKDMIAEISTKSVEASVFDLTTAINSGRGDRAYEILTELLKNKTEPTIIIGTLAFGYVDIYRAKTAYLNKSGNREITDNFPSYKGKTFRLDKALNSARNLSIEQIKELIGAVSDADIRIKSFSVDNRVILEELIAKLLYIAGGKR